MSTSCSTSSPTSSSSAGCRATRSRRTAPTCCSSGSGSSARGATRSTSTTPGSTQFVSELAEGRGDKPGAKPATLQRKVACLRSFHRHLRRQNLIEDDPTAQLKAPRQSRKLPQVLTRDEVAKLLAQPAGTEPAALRDRALLEVMYACGLRASEAIDLEVGDLDLEARVLRARGKGSKERLVPVGSAAARALGAYLGARPPEAGRRPLRGAAVRQPPRPRPHAPGALQDRPALRGVRRAREQDEPAHAAPHLRHPPAGGRLRPALAAGDARARRRRDDPALHAALGGAPEGRLLRRPPARRAETSTAASSPPDTIARREPPRLRRRPRCVRRGRAARRRRLRGRGHQHARPRLRGGRRARPAGARAARARLDPAARRRPARRRAGAPRPPAPARARARTRSPATGS